MWAGNLKNQTYKNSGKLQLNFEHTLSKLHIYAQKNEELANSTVVLKEVKLIDYLSGDLSLATGEFSSATDTRIDNTDHILYTRKRLKLMKKQLKMKFFQQ